MNYRQLTDADLVDFSKNVADQLTNHKVTGIDNALADDLAATITPLNTTFETSIETGVVSTAEKQSVIAGKQLLRDDLIPRLATIRNYLVAAECKKDAFEICGFTFPVSGGTIIAQTPTDLVAAGTSNGVNTIKFRGNNRPGTVVYEIWRLHGDTLPFTILATTRKQAYVDTPVVPGEYYAYKVRAIAATNKSNFSNVAVVYGVSPAA